MPILNHVKIYIIIYVYRIYTLNNYKGTNTFYARAILSFIGHKKATASALYFFRKSLRIYYKIYKLAREKITYIQVYIKYE